MHMVRKKGYIKKKTKMCFNFCNMINILKHFKMKSMTLSMESKEYKLYYKSDAISISICIAEGVFSRNPLNDFQTSHSFFLNFCIYFNT